MVSVKSLCFLAATLISTVAAQRGSFETLNGINSYVVKPKGPKADKAILFVTDIYGHATENAKGVANKFAKAGYLVVVPDLFNGDAWTADRDIAGLPAWGAQFGVEVTDPKLDSVLAAIKTKYKPKVVGGTGYCFGGKYIFRLLSAAKIKTGVSAHPSFATLEEIGGVTGPVQIASAAVDASFSIDYRRQVEDVLIAGNKQYQFDIYSGVAHGYAVNANVSIPAQRYAKEQTQANAIAWFNAWL